MAISCPLGAWSLATHAPSRWRCCRHDSIGCCTQIVSAPSSAVDMLRTAKDVKAKLKADDQTFKPFMGKVRVEWVAAGGGVQGGRRSRCTEADALPLPLRCSCH